MSIRKIPYADHEEWLQIRKQYIGGSDAGAIMGMNPYASPFSVWAEKTGNAEPFAGNLKTKIGTQVARIDTANFDVSYNQNGNNNQNFEQQFNGMEFAAHHAYSDFEVADDAGYLPQDFYEKNGEYSINIVA